MFVGASVRLSRLGVMDVMKVEMGSVNEDIKLSVPVPRHGLL